MPTRVAYDQIIESTVSNKGIIQIASDTEVLDGTDKNKAVTPASLNTKLSEFESLPDQTGHSGAFLTTDGNTASWLDNPIIRNVRSNFTLTENQTEVTLSETQWPLIGNDYEVIVIRNGLFLTPDNDYSVNFSTRTITLVRTSSEGDMLSVIVGNLAYRKQLQTVHSREDFVSTEGQTIFEFNIYNLGNADAYGLAVYRNGLLQTSSIDYTLDMVNHRVTFLEPLENEEVVNIIVGALDTAVSSS